MAAFISKATTYGVGLCAYLNDPSHTQGELLLADYYDGTKSFLSLADYTGDASWLPCAATANAIYRDGYVLPNNGGAQGYRVFTNGLLFDWKRSASAASKSAIHLLATNAAFNPDGVPAAWTEDSSMSREVAYAIMAELDDEETGTPRRDRLALLEGQALEHIDQWWGTRTAPYRRPFMNALTAKALIAYDEKIGDPRVLPNLVTMANALWAEMWVPAARAFRYTDIDTKTLPQFLPDGTPNPAYDSGGTDPAPDLNLLVAPLYAWVYAQTGDPTFAAEYDAIFAAGIDLAFWAGPKQFNQQLYFSFEGIRWRPSR